MHKAAISLFLLAYAALAQEKTQTQACTYETCEYRDHALIRTKALLVKFSKQWPDAGLELSTVEVEWPKRSVFSIRIFQGDRTLYDVTVTLHKGLMIGPAVNKAFDVIEPSLAEEIKRQVQTLIVLNGHAAVSPAPRKPPGPFFI